jgi:hypothetical protein
MPVGARDFFLSKTSRPAVGSTQLLFNGYRLCVPGVKRPGCEVNYSPPSGPEVKNGWSYTSSPPLRLHGVYFTFSNSEDL